MGFNIEIKARVRDLENLRALVEELGERPGTLIFQEDTFFNTPHGRLKLRVFSPDCGELIYYQRTDLAGPKRSDYWISPTADPKSLKKVLSESLGVRGVVRKRRMLFFIGNTRIHLDEVDGLGSFFELEVVLEPSQSDAEGHAMAKDLMVKLGVDDTDLVEWAYIDLLEGRSTPSHCNRKHK